MEAFWKEYNKIAILGGTFNPVHNGHVMMAKTVLEQVEELELLVILPNNLPAYKNASAMIDTKHRVRMLELAFGSKNFYSYGKNVAVSTLEIDRGGVTYTIDTLNHIKSMSNDIDIYFVIGADSLFTIRKWYQFTEVLKKCKLLVLARDCNNEELEQCKKELEMDFPYASIRILVNEEVKVSSSNLRDMVATKKDISQMVPDTVNEYIKANHLYEV